MKHLAQELLGSASSELAERITAEAQGSPFFARELARRAMFTSEPPLTLQEALAAHVGRLQPATRNLLEVVAIAGRPIQERIATDAAATDHTAIDLLRDEQLLRHTSGASERMIECYHDRIRESVVGGLDAAQTRRIHHQLMETLLRRENADPERLALHCDGAGERARAAYYAAAAGDAAHAALAYERAAELFRMALERSTDPPTKVALTIKLAQALSDGGRGAEAAPYFMEAASQTTPEQALELRRCAAEQWLVSGEIERGMTAFRDVLEAVGLHLPNSPRAALVELLMFRLKLWNRGRRFRSRSEPEIERAELLRIDACKTAWSLSFVRTITAAAFQVRHLVYALDAGEPNRIVLGLSMEAVYRSMKGPKSLKLVNELKREARGLVQTLDNPQAEAFVHFAEGNSNYLLGSWKAACDSLATAEEMFVGRCRNVSFELNSTRFFWANALVFRGCWRELGSRLDAWLKDAHWRGDRYARATLLLVRARSVTLSRGNVPAAQAEIDEAMGLWSAPEFGVQRFLAFITQLQLDLFERQPERSLDRINAFWPTFSKSLMSQVQVCRVSAYQQIAYVALALAANRPDEPRWTRGALKHAKALRMEKVDWATAFADFIEASVAQQRGNRAEAITGLRAAADAFTRVGMDGYGAATRHKLGELIGGNEGDALLAASNQFFIDQGVTESRSLAYMRAPGIAG
jgi:hypothetical protein